MESSIRQGPAGTPSPPATGTARGWMKMPLQHRTPYTVLAVPAPYSGEGSFLSLHKTQGKSSAQGSLPQILEGPTGTNPLVEIAGLASCCSQLDSDKDRAVPGLLPPQS